MPFLQDFIDSCFNSFLHKVSSPLPKPFTVPKRLIHFPLLFTGLHFLQIQTQLRKLFSPAFPHITIRFVSRPTVQLSSLFSFKNRIPTRLRSHVVYKFTCQGCGALYIGETSRHLHTRVSDHLGISTLTGKKRKCPTPTAILSHHADTGHLISFDDFKIISTCYSVSKLLLRESLLISKLKPSLNTNMGSAPLFLFWFIFIAFTCTLTFYGLSTYSQLV